MNDLDQLRALLASWNNAFAVGHGYLLAERTPSPPES
jgi:hypothetical protein